MMMRITYTNELREELTSRSPRTARPRSGTNSAQQDSRLQYIRSSSSFFFPCFASKNDPSQRIMLSSLPSTPNKTMSNLLKWNLSRSRAVLQYTWRPENGEGSMCKLTHSDHLAFSFKFFFHSFVSYIL